MNTIETYHDFPATKMAIWDLLQDFGNIQRWWPTGQAVDIDHVDIEGEGPGMIRHIYNVGFESAVSEQLLSIQPEDFSYTLTIVGDRPAGLTYYQATGTLTDLSDGQTRLTYTSEFEAEPGREDEARTFLLGAYALMFEGLSQNT